MVQCLVPRLRTVPWVVRDERNRSSAGIDFGFRNKFCARAISPVPKEHSCEWTFTLRHYKIRCHGTTLGTGIVDVVKRAPVEFFDHFLADIERLFYVIVEQSRSR